MNTVAGDVSRDVLVEPSDDFFPEDSSTGGSSLAAVVFDLRKLFHASPMREFKDL